MGALARILVVAGALLAAAPAAAGVPELRGAQTHPFWNGVSASDTTRELDALVAGGANAVRVDISWSTLELDGPGEHSAHYVAKIDAFMAAARQRGIRVIAVFWTTPCWASSAPPEVRQDCEGEWWERGVERYPPSDPDDFAAAAAWVAQRWGADLAAIELWNEANFHPFFRSDAPARDYAELVAAAYPRIKEAAPGLAVIGPAMLHSDAQFVDALYDEGAGDHLDGISSHPFVGPRSPYDSSPTSPSRSFADGIPSVQAVLEAHGDGDKPQWLTELGWSSCAPGGTSSWCVTLEQQAQHVGDALEIIRDRWDFVAAAVVYNLRNKGTSATDRESQMGLLFRDFSPKPAWAEFTRMMGSFARAAPPSAATGDTRGVGTDSAVVAGSVDARELPTTWWFEYGETAAYGAETPPRSLPAASGAHAVEETLSGLAPGRTYHYRLVAENALGAAAGPDHTFRTASAALAPALDEATGLPAPSVAAGESPVLGRLRVQPRAFRAPRRRATRARSVARVTYTLSRPASVEFALERCRRKGCRPLGGGFTRAGRAGANSFGFSRVVRRRLRPGRYRLVAAPVAGELRGAARRAAFRLVP